MRTVKSIVIVATKELFIKYLVKLYSLKASIKFDNVKFGNFIKALASLSKADK
jgi:hypothetical protein